MSSSISGLGGGSSHQVWAGASGASYGGGGGSSSMNQKMSDLFGKIDSSNSGTITKAQFEQAFKSMKSPNAVQAQGADQMWSKIDPSGSGSVNQSDFVKGMEAARKARHSHTTESPVATSSPTSQTVNQSLSALNSLTPTPPSPSPSLGTQVDVDA